MLPNGRESRLYFDLFFIIIFSIITLYHIILHYQQKISTFIYVQCTYTATTSFQSRVQFFLSITYTLIKFFLHSSFTTLYFIRCETYYFCTAQTFIFRNFLPQLYYQIKLLPKAVGSHFKFIVSFTITTFIVAAQFSN